MVDDAQHAHRRDVRDGIAESGAAIGIMVWGVGGGEG
jgi:hypothetical protein